MGVYLKKFGGAEEESFRMGGLEALNGEWGRDMSCDMEPCNKEQ